MNAHTLSLEAGSHLGAAAQAGVARIKRSYAPPAPVSGRSASNDAAYRAGRDRAAELDGWARRAATANGFGDHAEFESSRSGFDTHRLAAEARAARDASLAAIVGVLFEAMADGARRLYESWAITREAHATYRARRESDTRPLRDLVPDRTGTGSVSDDFASAGSTFIAFTPGDSPLLYKTAGMRELAADISRWMAGTARRYVEAWRQRRLARATYQSLRGLDVRTLRDVGLDHSEMGSVAAEIAGEADRTRMQALRTLRALSLY